MSARIQQIYIAMFGRPADPLGLQSWNTTTNNGANLAPMINALAGTAEYQARYTGLTNVQAVNAIYQSLFGRDADVAGLTFFVNELASGRQTVATIAVNILDGAQGTDKARIDNKVVAATNFTTAVNTTPEILAYNASAIPAAQAFLTPITDVATTIPTAAATDAAIAAIVSGSSGGTTGQTFTLTTSVDNLVGTSGNDSFVADNSGATATLSAADSVNGGNGVDTVRIFQAAATNVANTIFGTLTSVENAQINGGTLTNTGNLNVSTLTGLTGVSIVNPFAVLADADAFTVTTAANTSVGLTGVRGTALGVTSTVTINNGATATSSALTLNGVSTDVTLDLASALVATANVTNTGAASTVALTNTGTALRTINISADAAFTGTLNAAMSGAVTTVNAAASTAAVSINTSAAINGPTFAFTGGAGNDTLTLADNALGTIAAGTALNGGEGARDKLGLFDIALSAGETTKLNAATGFEVLGLNANITVDTSTVTSFKTYSLDTAGLTVVLNNVGVGTTLENGAVTTAAATIAPALGVSSSAVVLNGSTTAASVITSLTATGVTALSIASNGTAGVATNAITNIVNSDNSTITITGSRDLSFSLAVGTAVGSVIDATAATGVINAAGSDFGDIIRGGTGNDFLNGNGGADKLTGGAGNDIIRVDSRAETQGAAFVVGNTSFTNIDHITDFAGNGAAAGDSFQLSGVANVFGAVLDFDVTTTATVTAVTVATAADFTTLAAAIQAASAGVASVTGIGGNARIYDVTVSAGNLAGRVLVLNDETALIAATDTFINITGVVGALNAQDFTFV